MFIRIKEEYKPNIFVNFWHYAKDTLSVDIFIKY
jgi:hypothetical protein